MNILLPAWVDQLANTLALVATAFVIAAAASWAGLDNWIVAIALGLAVAWLFPNFVEPVKRLLKGIFVEVFKTLAELLAFVGAWLRGVLEYFQGNLVRAVLQILIVAAFMWIWNLALGIPVIRQLFTNIVERTAQVITYINHLFDQALSFIDQLRRRLIDTAEHLLRQMGILGGAIRGEVVGLINRLFGGFTREIQQLRAQIVTELDVVRRFVDLRVEVLGVRIRLVPEEARKQLWQLWASATARYYAELSQAVENAGPLPSSPSFAGHRPPEVAAELLRKIPASVAELPSSVPAVVDELVAALTAAAAGEIAPPATFPEEVRTVLSESELLA